MQDSRKRTESFERGNDKACIWSLSLPSRTRLTRSKLVNAGFYFDPSKKLPDRCTCFLCNASTKYPFLEEDVALEIHADISPNCPIVLIYLHAKKWAADVLRAANKKNAVVDNRYAATNPEMLAARIATFGTWWPHENKKEFKSCSVQKMAEAGFSYLSIDSSEENDAVVCSLCDINLDGWEPGDDPRHEHQKRRPNCAFFIKPPQNTNTSGLRSRLRRNYDNSASENMTESESESDAKFDSAAQQSDDAFESTLQPKRRTKPKPVDSESEQDVDEPTPVPKRKTNAKAIESIFSVREDLDEVTRQPKREQTKNRVVKQPTAAASAASNANKKGKKKIRVLDSSDSEELSVPVIETKEARIVKEDEKRVSSEKALDKMAIEQSEITQSKAKVNTKSESKDDDLTKKKSSTMNANDNELSFFGSESGAESTVKPKKPTAKKVAAKKKNLVGNEDDTPNPPKPKQKWKGKIPVEIEETFKPEIISQDQKSVPRKLGSSGVQKEEAAPALNVDDGRKQNQIANEDDQMQVVVDLDEFFGRKKEKTEVFHDIASATTKKRTSGRKKEEENGSESDVEEKGKTRKKKKVEPKVVEKAVGKSRQAAKRNSFELVDDSDVVVDVDAVDELVASVFKPKKAKKTPNDVTLLNKVEVEEKDSEVIEVAKEKPKSLRSIKKRQIDEDEVLVVETPKEPPKILRSIKKRQSEEDGGMSDDEPPKKSVKKGRVGAARAVKAAMVYNEETTTKKVVSGKVKMELSIDVSGEGKAIVIEDRDDSEDQADVQKDDENVAESLIEPPAPVSEDEHLVPTDVSPPAKKNQATVEDIAVISLDVAAEPIIDKSKAPQKKEPGTTSKATVEAKPEEKKKRGRPRKEKAPTDEKESSRKSQPAPAETATKVVKKKLGRKAKIDAPDPVEPKEMIEPNTDALKTSTNEANLSIGLEEPNEDLEKESKKKLGRKAKVVNNEKGKITREEQAKTANRVEVTPANEADPQPDNQEFSVVASQEDVAVEEEVKPKEKVSSRPEVLEWIINQAGGGMSIERMKNMTLEQYLDMALKTRVKNLKESGEEVVKQLEREYRNAREAIGKL